MTRYPPAEGWRARILGSRLPWNSQPIRPAGVGAGLQSAMLAQENLLEDANYQKIAPNQFVVELAPEAYARNFQPIEDRILGQWKDSLLEYLATQNSRLGRQEYRLGGPLQLELRTSNDLKPPQARIFSRVAPDARPKTEADSPALPACLESWPGGRRYPLRPGIVTLGRSRRADIQIDTPIIQEKRLVSSLHAYIHCDSDRYRVFDGSPGGKPSTNGTYVNSRPVPAGGVDLADGDMLVLAAVDPSQPRPDTPGVAALYFKQNCESRNP